MDVLHHAMLSQLMSRKLTSETAANALLADLVEGISSGSLARVDGLRISLEHTQLGVCHRHGSRVE